MELAVGGERSGVGDSEETRGKSSEKKRIQSEVREGTEAEKMEEPPAGLQEAMMSAFSSLQLLKPPAAFFFVQCTSK